MKFGSHAVIGLGGSVLGLVVGVAVDATYHPNYMRVWIDPLNELRLAPQNGDIIQWSVLGAPDQHVSIDFGANQNNSPCQPGPTGVGICVVQYPNTTGTFYYKCQAGGNDICDPNLGPSSGTGPGPMITISYLSRLLDNIGRSFAGKQRSPENEAKPTALLPTKRAGASVSCTSSSNGTTQVVPEGQAADTPIVISPGGKINWSSPAGNYGTGFSLTLPNGLCSSFDSSLAVCVVDSGIAAPKDYTYTAQVIATPCAVSKTEAVQVRQ